MRCPFAPAILLLGGLPAFAQTSNASQPTGAFQAEITVTATAESESVAEVPVSVTVVPHSELEDRQAVEALTALETVPGLATTRSGSPGKVASLFTRGTNSNHTLVLWNGVELNDPYLGGFDLSTLSLDGAERLEIARGPFSALYGSSAVGGVVQVVTRRSGRTLSARLEAGSRDLLRVGASAGGALGGARVEVAGHVRRGDGEVDNDFWDGDELVASLDAGGDRGWRGGLLARAIRSEIGIPFDYAGVATPERRQHADALSLALPFGWGSERVEVETQVAGTRTDLEVADPGDPFAASRAEAERGQARASVRWQAGPGWHWTVGGEWERASVDSSSAFGPALRGESERVWAAFAQASYAGGPLRVDAGVRRDEQDAFGGETSFRAAAALAIGASSRLRAAYGESFRAPSLADLYYPGFSNPELRPELGTSYELAFETGGGPWRATVALFRNDLDGLIEFDFSTSRPQNLGRARAQGIEAELAYRNDRFEARWSGTWLDAEDRATGDRLLRRPDESTSLLLYVRPGEWTLGAIGRYVGDRIDFGDVPLSSYATLDLTAARRLGERFEPFARVENVTDERYEEAAGFPAPRRGFVAGCLLRF